MFIKSSINPVRDVPVPSNQQYRKHVVRRRVREKVERDLKTPPQCFFFFARHVSNPSIILPTIFSNPFPMMMIIIDNSVGLKWYFLYFIIIIITVSPYPSDWHRPTASARGVSSLSFFF